MTAVVALAVGGGIMFFLSPTQGSTLSRDVKVACHSYIKDLLGTPPVMRFSSETVAKAGNQYIAQGQLHARNRNGALPIHTYSCTVEQRKGVFTLSEVHWSRAIAV